MLSNKVLVSDGVFLLQRPVATGGLDFQGSQAACLSGHLEAVRLYLKHSTLSCRILVILHPRGSLLRVVEFLA